MTIPLGNAEHHFQEELSSRPERSGVERSAVLRILTHTLLAPELRPLTVNSLPGLLKSVPQQLKAALVRTTFSARLEAVPFVQDSSRSL
jgi:hypothetical protein